MCDTSEVHLKDLAIDFTWDTEGKKVQSGSPKGGQVDRWQVHSRRREDAVG